GRGGGHHGGLGGTAAQMAEQRNRRLDEVVARPGGFQQGTEQHEQKDETCRYAYGHSEHAFGGQPQVAHALGERGSTVGDQVGHVLAEENIAEEGYGQNHDRQAECPPGGFQQQHQASDRYDQIECGGQARAGGEFGVEQVQ